VIYLFDTGFLHLLFDDRAKVPKDRHGKPTVDRIQERIDYLVQTISQRRGKIVIAAPSLAEFLLLAEEKYADYLTIIRRKSVFEVAGFDDPEAVELAEHWKKHGDRKKLKPNTSDTWAKMKYDRQIVAIAVTRRIECIYSTDKDLHRFAEQLNIKSCDIADLPLPPPRQLHLVGEQPTDTSGEAPIKSMKPEPPEEEGASQGSAMMSSE
jgi:hypothetical protein